MAKSGLFSDIEVNLRLFREWYSLKGVGCLHLSAGEDVFA